MATMRVEGKVSWFGGPHDEGVAPDEGLAFIYSVEDAPFLFLPEQPPGTTGLARRLDPDVHYVACRWDYDLFPKNTLLKHQAMVRSVRTGHFALATPADWGPHESTGRVADISPGLMEALGIVTDDVVEVTYPYGDVDMIEGPEWEYYTHLCISSGHGSLVRGASGILDEVDEARKVVDRVAQELISRGVVVNTFHDDTSTTQDENLEAIVDWHNSQDREIDISVHFNAFEQTSEPRGTEVLYYSEYEIASELSAAIANAGTFIDRGPKQNTGLYFLSRTDAPAVLIEVCFVDSSTDAGLYNKYFDRICSAIADTLGGPLPVEGRPPRPPISMPPRIGRVDVEVSGPVVVTVNGVVVSGGPT
jgi:N-acetylmuramoyl-L-alanine amidase-like protein